MLDSEFNIVNIERTEEQLSASAQQYARNSAWSFVALLNERFHQVFEYFLGGFLLSLFAVTYLSITSMFLLLWIPLFFFTLYWGYVKHFRQLRHQVLDNRVWLIEMKSLVYNAAEQTLCLDGTRNRYLAGEHPMIFPPRLSPLEQGWEESSWTLRCAVYLHESIATAAIDNPRVLVNEFNDFERGGSKVVALSVNDALDVESVIKQHGIDFFKSAQRYPPLPLMYKYSLLAFAMFLVVDTFLRVQNTVVSKVNVFCYKDWITDTAQHH
ncbi:MAG: hypothetical protein VXW65_02260 [Pseudomonadota bacterium]|nr:hypothetical protein [Pseudomonadota bacterium]